MTDEELSSLHHTVRHISYDVSSIGPVIEFSALVYTTTNFFGCWPKEHTSTKCQSRQRISHLHHYFTSTSLFYIYIIILHLHHYFTSTSLFYICIIILHLHHYFTSASLFYIYIIILHLHHYFTSPSLFYISIIILHLHHYFRKSFFRPQLFR